MSSTFTIVWRTLILICIFRTMDLVNGKPMTKSDANLPLGISLFDRLRNYSKRSVPVYVLDDNAAYNTKRDNEPVLRGKFKNCYFSIVQCIIPSWLSKK